MNFAKFLRTPFLTEYLLWLFLQPATLLKKRFPLKCFSVNLAKFLKTSFDGALPDDGVLSLSVNFEKFLCSKITSHTCVTHVKNIRRHYGGQPEISVSQNPLAGKHFFDIMVNFCAVFNCGNRASREKEK